MGGRTPPLRWKTSSCVSVEGPHPPQFALHPVDPHLVREKDLKEEEGAEGEFHPESS